MIQEVDAQADEIRRLRRDLLRVTSGRDILKKATAYFARESPPLAHANMPCRAAGEVCVYRRTPADLCCEGYVPNAGRSSERLYAWLREPFCQRALEDQRQTVLLKQAWVDSGEVYGCPLPGR